jgi:ATP-binding cassette subfamily F protein 3
VITVSRLRKSFGARALFRDAELRVGARDRVALIGPNGSGKTTLLEIVMGMQPADSGEITTVRDAVLGYLPQETDALRGRSVLDEVVSAGTAMAEAGHRLQVLHNEIEDTGDGPERSRLLEEYAHLQERFEALGGYTLEAQARRILAGLGFADDDLERRTESLSGGWLMRVALAKLLLQAPDCLLLDEPTNHLDLESVAWLERFLRGYDGAVVVISHDRDFMNGLVNRVVEIADAKLVSYTGDYEAFVRQRDARMAQLAAAARNQSKQIERTEAFINRFRYKASKARQVQSRVKALEKLERIDVPKAPVRKMKLGFPPPPRSGRVVIELAGVRFAYGSKLVYDGLDLTVERGQKVALVGPNGAGKTTLLKLLAGVLVPQAGVRTLGHNADLGYFAQHQIEALEPSNRVIQELERAIPPTAALRPRDLLGRFLFSGDDVDKPMSVLSGGERTRLAMAKLLVSPHNVLCLDEPTNHLDIPSRDVLEDALVEYGGALVLITHDRHLIRSVANRIVEVADGKVHAFDGDYESYLYRTEREEASPAPAEPVRSVRPAPRRASDRADLRRRRAELRRLEAELDSAQSGADELAKLLADPGFYTSGDGVAEKIDAYEKAQQRVRELEKQWEMLAEELEATSSP